MVAPRIPEADFIELFRTVGPTELKRRGGYSSIRTVFERRKAIEQRLGISLEPPILPSVGRTGQTHAHRAEMQIDNGIVIVGSDLHAWPGEAPTAFRAFVKFIKDPPPRLDRPAAVVMNGDVIDGASISRHPPIGWEKQPTLIEEMEVAQERLQEVVLAAPRKARLFWPLGNHDARFSTRLATVAPEYAKVHGTRLQDHFGERWEPCWSVWFNESVICKHRHKGGIHAVHNSTLWAGKTMITGHLHSLKVTPFTDYTSTRFGVDTGCLADIGARAFLYLEDNPTNWRSGFVVLTFRGGRLMWPELVHVIEPGKVEFRGEVISV